MRLCIVRLWNRHAAFIKNATAGSRSTVLTSNTTSTKSLTCRKSATANGATSRHLINCHGKMRSKTFRRDAGCAAAGQLASGYSLSIARSAALPARLASVIDAK
jgi:hypothetical protein